MPRLVSSFPTLSAVVFSLCALTGVAGAVAPAIRLADPARVPFPGQSLVVADLDGAAGNDLLGVDGANVVAVLNDGHGNFGAPLTIPMGGFTLSTLAAGDLDGDGRHDLAALSSTGSSVVIRLQGPGLTFSPPANAALPGRPWWGLALGDLNGDGRPDLAATCWDSQCVAVLLNDGAGHFGSALRLDVPRALSKPLIGDFNGDGLADLALGVYAPPQLFLLLGHGDGTFDPPVAASPEGTVGVHLAAADLDGDGDLDIVDNYESALSVFRNQGDGSFGAALTVGPTSGAYFDPVVGDVDRDGRPDIALTQRGNWFGPIGFLVVYRNRGDLSFGPAAKYGVGPGPQDAALADLDGDGWPEGVATCDDLGDGNCYSDGTPGAFVLHNSGAGALEGMLEVREPVWLPARDGAHALPDLLGAAPDGRQYRARNLGNGTFEPAEVVGWGTPIEARDLDGDGDDDLIVTSHDSLWIQQNLGPGGFVATPAVFTGLDYHDAADFDLDDHLDLLATDATGELLILSGDGALGFAPPTHTGRILPWPTGLDNVRAVDLNGDGAADVAYSVASRGGYYVDDRCFTRLFTMLNDGTGGLDAPDSSVADLPCTSGRSHGSGFLRLGDWNGDGVTDALHVTASCQSGNSATELAFLGTGGGAFAVLGPTGTGNSSWCGVRTGDLNGDHLDDVVLVASTSGCIYHAIVRASDGMGGFSAGGGGPMGVQPQDVRLADLDGDGRLDVLTRNLWYGEVQSYSIRRNVTLPLEPVPTLISLVSSDVERGLVRLDWFAAGLPSFSATVERRTGASGWTALGARTSDGTGHLRYDDADIVPGSRYAYRLRVSGATAPGTETWVDVPGLQLALRGAWPNPAPAHPTLALSVPVSGDGEVRVFDVAGRQVHRERLTGLRAGAARVRLGGTGLGAGLYLAKFEFGGHSLQTRFVVVP